MSAKYFISQTHYIDSSYIRQYPHALSGDQEDTLKVAFKQHVPLDNPSPRPGDVTLLAAHANGVGKELYEPLWDDLLEASKRSKNFRIRSIWIADVAWQGESGVLNEEKLGDDPSWYDHPRDLLHFINLFRKELPRPIIGVGHSMGGNHVANLALMHPRLLSGLILIDPVIQRVSSKKGNSAPAVASTYRRDLWPSREDAKAAFLRNKFYQSWDSRVFDRWIEYGLRDLPTAVHPSYVDPKTKQPAPAGSKPVTLTTTKYQEVFTFLRGNHPAPGTSLQDHVPDKKTHPDLTGETLERPFYNPAPIITFSNLPHLRPPVLYVFASEQSMLSEHQTIKERLEATGTGVGGSGGVKAGAVQVVDVKGAGHFVPFEKPGEVAGEMSGWLEGRLGDWKRDEKAERAAWAKVPERKKRVFSEDRLYWTEVVGKEMRAAREKEKKSEPKL